MKQRYIRAENTVRSLPLWTIRSVVVVVASLACWALTSAVSLDSKPELSYSTIVLEEPTARTALVVPMPSAALPSSSGNGTSASRTQTPLQTLQSGSDAVPAVTPAVNEAPPFFPPVSQYEPGLRPEQAYLMQGLSHLPRYEIEVELFPDLQTLSGKAAIGVINNSSSEWASIVFRLQANMPNLLSNMQVQTIEVDGQPVSPADSASPTVLTIPLVAPLAPGDWIHVDFEWLLQYYLLDDLETYVRMGANQDMINLPHFYPELAVYAPGAPGTNSEGWWIAEIPAYADIRFHESTLMRVTATMPTNLVAVGSGYHLDTLQLEDGRSRHQWVTGPVRGFVLQASPLYLVTKQEVNGVIYSSYFHANDEAIARQALGMAQDALQTFEKLWGPYPYSHLAIVSSPLNVSGMEYSNLIQIGVLLYRDKPYDAEFLMTHEIAHQWLYLQVHNDPVHFPSLDEGLAELAYVLFNNAKEPNYFKHGFVSFWRQILLDFEADYIGEGEWWKAYPYLDLQHFYWTHYTRPAVLLDEVWSIMGDRPFGEALREYIQNNRFEIVTPEDLELLFQPLTTEDQMFDLKQAWRIPSAPPS